MIEAATAVTQLAAAVNRGGRQSDVAEALGAEHGYLVNQIVYAVAWGVMRKCRFAIDGALVKSCGDVMYPLAIDGQESRERRSDHPYHDGELTCNAVRGALVTLNEYVQPGSMVTPSWQQSDSWIWRTA